MTRTTHPRVLARGTRTNKAESTTQVLARSVLHAMVYAPTPERRQWVEHELKDTTIQIAHDVGELVSALTEDSRARPPILIIDLDALSAGELFHLHQIRERGWCGTILALGQVPPSLHASLQITRALRAPFVEHALSDEVIKYRCATEEQTTPIPVFLDEPTLSEHKTYG